MNKCCELHGPYRFKINKGLSKPAIEAVNKHHLPSSSNFSSIIFPMNFCLMIIATPLELDESPEAIIFLIHFFLTLYSNQYVKYGSLE